MIRDAIDRILELREAPTVMINGLNYKKAGYSPVLEHHPNSLGTKTLTSIVDFYKNNVDGWKNRDPFVAIEDHQTVNLVSERQGDFNQRIMLVSAEAVVTDFNFGDQYGQESFIIALNSQFLPGEDREYLLGLISTLSVEASETLSDNGISQNVKRKTGITTKETDKTKNPVALRPFRTFGEIEQPESEFLLRVSQEGRISCSLHPSDGSMWKLTAIKSIKEFFKKELPDVTIIG